MKTKTIALTLLILLLTAIFIDADATRRKRNAYGQQRYTVESAHFRIHYHKGLEHLTPRVANRLEELRRIYTDVYHITLPSKTDVVLYDSEIPEGFTYPNFNFIYVSVHDYEFNLRGSGDWLDDVLAHEYAHVVSIHTGLKLPPIIPGIQAGYFTHPNTATRFEGLHLFPSETMPVWFVEGIAQYESKRNDGDRWDTHRDMIMRVRTLSGKQLSWPHMQVFAGRGDDFEMAYNHGFSLVMYISETYGYDKIVSILRENARISRLSFDGSVRAVLGISAKQLYDEWQESLRIKYSAQIRAIGQQIYGRKINQTGYDNRHPMFSPDGHKIYFISNADHDYSLRSLYSYNLSNVIPQRRKIRFEMPIASNFDIDPNTGKIIFTSMKSRRSYQKPEMGGQKLLDLFIDELPSDKPKLFSRKTEKQITERMSVFAASFSPSGDKIAGAVRKFDKFFLAIIDTSGNDTRIVYPHVGSADDFFNSALLPEGSDTAAFDKIFSLNWSPNGKEIAIDFTDGGKRKIGIYDTAQKKFSIMFNDSKHDRRNPSFNRDGSALYYSSDETGIFNIYRYIFKTETVERLTNVSGGAFHPAVSSDERKLVYSGYDRNGYGIYLIDTIRVLQSDVIPIGNAITPREKREPQTFATPLSNRRAYSSLPRQMLVVPTLIAEQGISHDNDENSGITHVKGGVVINFMDPLAWGGIGNEGGAYLLVDLRRILNFIDLDRGFISPYANYDAGAFFASSVLPVNIEAEAMIRGITGEDWFFDESEGRDLVLPYQIRLTNALFGISPPRGGPLNLQLFAGLDRYDVAIDMKEVYGLGVFNYNLSKGYRAGALAWFAAMASNSRSNISPTGIAGKVQYNLWKQHSLKEENSFSIESSIMKEQYDDYLFHQVDGRLLLGFPSPIYPRHDFHFSIGGSYLKPIGDQDIPSFYLPAARIPGYSFYFKHDKPRPEHDTTQRQDTLLITGKAVLTGQFSYRFPLWPGRIDRKLGFLYFDRLYGALNLSAGAGFDNPGDVSFNRPDWLVSYGTEVRLEAITFNSYPLALKFRWDYGADRATPEIFVDDREVILGGHRFTFSIGFNFDDWWTIPIIDYFSPARLRNSPGFRMGR
ncbi:MAG: hypothetical protein LBU70_11205 [Chitinispirillales bacterium]|jgi:hypothetical protein|nr:hypothetical protein [Chitinispirillales bacterium]